MRKLFSLLGLLVALSANAATYHFTNNVAAGVGDGSINNPWNPNYGFWHLSAGDIGYFHGGTSASDPASYYTNLLGTWPDQSQIWHSGTPGNPIQYLSYPGDTVILRPPAGAVNPALDFTIPVTTQSNPVHDLLFANFKMVGTNIGDTAHFVPILKVSDYAHDITFSNIDIGWSPSSHGVLVSDNPYHIYFLNCTVHDLPFNQGNGGNTAHAFYFSGDQYSNWVDHALIYNIAYDSTRTRFPGVVGTPNGITRYSGIGSSLIASYNIISNVDVGIGLYAGTNNLIKGNLIKDSIRGIVLQDENTGGGVFNNTASKAYFCGVCVTGSNTRNNAIYDNLVTDDSYAGFSIDAGTPVNYFTNNGAFDNHILGWQNFYDLSGVQVQVGNLFGDQYAAAYVDISTGDYRIGASSSARNAGINPSDGYTVDAGGVSVPQEGIRDIGRHEYNTGGTTPTVQFGSNDSQAFEQASSPGSFTITRSLDGTNVTLTVNYQVAGTAINGTDYTTITTNRVFSAGDISKTITITPTDDAGAEGSETVIINIWPSANYSITGATNATMTIVDNDSAATVNVGRKGPQ